MQIVRAYSLSLQSNLTPAYNLCPLNLPTHYLVIYLFISICVNNTLHSLHSSMLYPCSSRNWKKTAGSRWTCFGVRGSRTFDYPTINWNPRKNALYDHNARPSQTDRRLNIIAIARRFVLRMHRALKILLVSFFWCL